MRVKLDNTHTIDIKLGNPTNVIIYKNKMFGILKKVETFNTTLLDVEQIKIRTLRFLDNRGL